jgi:ferredoxin-NADP reductase
MAMLRHHAALNHQAAMHLVYSARTQHDLLYRNELGRLVDVHRAVTITLTRESPSEWSGRRGRVDSDLLSECGWPPADEPCCYVCGPTDFVEAVANSFVAIGHEAANVRTERFGPTGGG